MSTFSYKSYFEVKAMYSMCTCPMKKLCQAWPRSVIHASSGIHESRKQVGESPRLGPTTLHTRDNSERLIQHDRHMAALSWQQSVKLLRPPSE